jgi:HEAT repeat protein
MIIILLIFIQTALSQNQQAEIDSLVKELRTAGRDWTDYSNPLIEIGEPAVPALINNALDKSLPQWNRRISMETLNQIHSEVWLKPALNILFDESEIPDLRNRATAGLRGFDLSDVKTKLWELYRKTENQFYKSNLAALLLTADTTLAYNAFSELYETQDGHIQRFALQSLIQLRPRESTTWLLDAIQGEDWMTGNLAMDSLITSNNFKPNELISVYNKTETSDEVQWRITFIFGKRNEESSIPFLIGALQNESWLVHNEATVALSRFNPDVVLEKLKALKKDDRPYVRINAKWVIKQITFNPSIR